MHVDILSPLCGNYFSNVALWWGKMLLAKATGQFAIC